MQISGKEGSAFARVNDPPQGNHQKFSRGYWGGVTIGPAFGHVLASGFKL
jgi:hypothetical protein